MPPKIDFKADDSAIDFQEVDPTGETFNLNDVVKLKPYQMAGFVNPEDITTGPERTINPITKRDDNEGFWSKALNLPEARKAERNDSIMFSSGLDYSKVGEFIKEHLPEGKISDLLAGLGSFIASTPEAVLSDPTTPAIGLLGAGKALAPRAELKTRLENIKTAPVEPIPDAPKLRLGLTAEGKLEPRGLISPEEFTSQQTIKALEGKPLELRKPVDFVPDSVKAEPIVQAEPGNIQPESSIPVVNNESRVVSDSTANRLADLAKQFVSDTEGSLKPKELVENVKQQVLRLRGKTPEEVNTIKQELISALSNKRRIDTNQLYSLVQDRLSKAQFEKTLINLLDSGEIQKSIPKKAAKSIPLPANVNEAQTPEQAIDILMNNIKANTAARIEQDLAVSAERKARINEAANVSTGGMQGYFEQLSKLKGKYPAVKAEIQKELISPQNVDAIRDIIMRSENLSDWDKIGAQGALAKIAGIKKTRGALQPSEIADLKKVFGERATNDLVELHSGLNIPKGMRTWEGIKQVSGDAKSLLASADFPGFFRVGINYAGQKEWRDSIVPAFKSYFSEGHASNVLEKLKSDPLYEWAHNNGLAITDYRSHSPLTREESIASLRTDKLPWVKASNRGQTVFADVLRFEKFKSLTNKYEELYNSLKKTAKTPGELAELEVFNPKGEYRAGKIADEVNTATGRGKLPGKLEAVADDFNALFFSPRLMSARMRSVNRILNPVMYMKYNKIERIEALKQLLSISSILGSSAAYAHLAGGRTSTNPLSTNFLKPRIGDTRLDPLGGYQQLIVPTIRMLMGGKASDNGKINVYGDYGVGNAVDTAEGFFENKASPFLGLAMALANRQEPTGEALNFTTLNPMQNTLAKHTFVPLIVQDLYDLFTHEPNLMQTFAVIPASFGVGAQTYNSSDNKPEKLKAKEERKQRKERLERLFPNP